MRRSAWKATLGALSIVLLLIVVGFLYIYSGAYNVAATEELSPVTRWIFGTAAERSIAAHAEPVEVPALQAGQRRTVAQHYQDMCATCHGGPGVEASWMGQGLTPEPPELDHAAEEFSAGELYWILEHGIKHTGMPALGPTHSEEEIKELVAFVQELPAMSPEAYQALTAGSASAGPGATGDSAAASHDHSTHQH